MGKHIFLPESIYLDEATRIHRLIISLDVHAVNIVFIYIQKFETCKLIENKSKIY